MHEKLARLVSASREVNSIEDYKTWISQHVRASFPFGMMVFALGRKTGDRIIVDAIAGVDYPDEFIIRIARTCEVGDRRVIARWVDTMVPQLIGEEDARSLFVGTGVPGICGV